MKTKKTKEQRRANDASSICAIESDCFSEMKEYRDNKRGNEKAAAIREVTISRTRNVLTPLTGRTITNTRLALIVTIPSDDVPGSENDYQRWKMNGCPPL